MANLIPELKLTLATNVGSLMALTAFVLCWVMGEDPLGGITLQSHSMDAAGLGAAYAAPLLLCRCGGVRGLCWLSVLQRGLLLQGWGPWGPSSRACWRSVQ